MVERLLWEQEVVGSNPAAPIPPAMLQPYNEKNKDLLVYINGELVHRDRAGVSPFDSAVQNGDAVWEGLRLYDGRIFKLKGVTCTTSSYRDNQQDG